MGRAILGACNWFTQWFDPAGSSSHEVFAETFVDLVLDGLQRRGRMRDS